MENKIERVFVYPSDLKFWVYLKSDKAVYNLYHKIQDAFNLVHDRCLTVFHLRDYYHITVEDVRSSLHPRI